MLSKTTIDTVKSTVPLLTEHGEAITRCFYNKLFTAHPELKNVFNMVNQQRGEQPRALADAVIAYAANIDNLEVLLPAVSRIANKHVSLGIKPEQYPLVGSNLLAAIQEVLALDDQHPALIAWAEAYGVLADIFINSEESIYQANEKQQSGWRGFKSFNIVDIQVETPEVKSFYLRPSDGGTVLDFKGGQYIGVKVHPDNSDYEAIRQYSLSGKSGGDCLRITSKAEALGLVSNYLHQRAIGDELLLQAPTGIFTLNDKAKKHIFVAGGVGITPMTGMLYEALQKKVSGDDILFIQCSRDIEYQIFSEELLLLQQEQAFYFKQCIDNCDISIAADHQGYLNQSVIRQWLGESEFTADKNTAVYFCGPLPFMKAQNQLFQSLGFTSDNIHYETFGPSASLENEVANDLHNDNHNDNQQKPDLELSA